MDIGARIGQVANVLCAGIMVFNLGSEHNWWSSVSGTIMNTVGYLLVIAICVMNVAMLNGWRPFRGKLRMHYAYWCGDLRDNYKPVTEIIRGAIKDERKIHYHVHQDYLGNPFGSEAKKLRVKYSQGHIKRREIIIKNGDYLIIPEPVD